MSLYIDEKYIGLVSSKLELFKRKGRALWNFRCPLCNDSEKSKTKARGYLYIKEDTCFYHCHNCSYTTNFAKFLEQVDPFLFKEYNYEKFKEGKHPFKSSLSDIKFNQPFENKEDKFKLDLDSIKDLQKLHYAKTYIEQRQIPIQFHDILYFSPDFRKLIERVNPEKAKNLRYYDPRIVIPFYTSGGDLFAVQGRALKDPDIRYITIKRPEYKDSLLMYGLERVNKQSKVYIVEGPIDSLFLPNSIAVAGSELMKVQGMFEDRVFVFDNEPHNKDICKNMAFAISRGNKVVIWPKNETHKDLNDMVLAGKDVQSLVDKNTYSGLEAGAKLAFWRKA